MLMADTFAIVFSVLGAILGHVALWLLLRALFPTTTQAAGSVIERGILLPLVVGVPLAFAAILLTVFIGSFLGSVGQALGVVIACSFVLYAHVGLAGVTAVLGARLGDGTETPWRAIGRGGAALSFAWLLPLLGWFALLPLSLLVGAGAATLGIVRRLTVPTPRAATLPPASVPSPWASAPPTARAASLPR